jgi:hypothetical protein
VNGTTADGRLLIAAASQDRNDMMFLLSSVYEGMTTLTGRLRSKDRGFSVR